MSLITEELIKEKRKAEKEHSIQQIQCEVDLI